jgi:hypothetical protein
MQSPAQTYSIPGRRSLSMMCRATLNKQSAYVAECLIQKVIIKPGRESELKAGRAGTYAARRRPSNYMFAVGSQFPPSGKFPHTHHNARRKQSRP